MAVRTLPLDMELVVYANTTLFRQFRWKPDGVPIDFTGWSALMLIGPYGSDAVYELDTAGGSVTLSTDGLITFQLSAADTEELATHQDLAYLLDLTDPAGFVLRFLRGRVTVVRDVERMP